MRESAWGSFGDSPIVVEYRFPVRFQAVVDGFLLGSSAKPIETPARSVIIVSPTGSWPSWAYSLDTLPRDPKQTAFEEVDGRLVVCMPDGYVVRGESGGVEILAFDELSAGLGGCLDLASSWVLAEEGGVVLHAAAVVVAGKSLLVVGESRSGKSTLSAMTAVGGGQIVSDDVVLLQSSGSEAFVVSAVRRHAWLRTDMASALPLAGLYRQSGGHGGEQTYCLSRDANSEFYRQSARVDACLFLDAPVRERLDVTTNAPCPPAEGLARLLAGSNSLLALPISGLGHKSVLATLSSLVASVPLRKVQSGRDLLSDGGVVRWVDSLGI